MHQDGRAWAAHLDAMRHLLLLCLLIGCDAVVPEPETGWMEGTFVLPDGTAYDFRDGAGAHVFEYSGLGTHDEVVIRTAYAGQRREDPTPVVSVGITQAGLQPVAGTFRIRRDGSGPYIGATFVITNVPGFVSGSPVISPSNVTVELPRGTVTVRVEGDRLRGEFDLEGWPLGGGTLDGVPVSDLDPSVVPRVRGRFDVAVSR